MNAVEERLQRAQRYLERAAHLEGTGQPKVCADYVRRAGELIEEAREDLAWQRGGFKPFALAAERLGLVTRKAFEEARGVLVRAAKDVQESYALAGPSKGEPS